MRLAVVGHNPSTLGAPVATNLHFARWITAGCGCLLRNRGILLRHRFHSVATLGAPVATNLHFARWITAGCGCLLRNRGILLRHRFHSVASAAITATSSSIVDNGGVLEVKEIKERFLKWQWKGQYSINYIVFHHRPLQQQRESNPDSTPLLLVHGFGASISHWRRNITTLSQVSTVYAIDLLGFGGSDKPNEFAYTTETWAQLILDFLDQVVKKPTVLIGNSLGSLACVIAASNSSRGLVRGLVLLNCAGGMNNKAIVDDWRIRLLLPLFWLIDFLLKQKSIASSLFERVKQRENIRKALQSVYVNQANVDDDLVEIIMEPANDVGALDAFVSTVTGPPGPNPVQLMPTISMPVLVLWGDKDPFTPLDGPVGKYFSTLPSQFSNVRLYVVEGVGHCPHDDRPDLVHQLLLPWLDSL